MKILYVTTIGATMGFFKSFIKELVDCGHSVDIATNETIAAVPDYYSGLGCKQYHLDCTRSPFDLGNFRCINQIKKIVQENEYDIVHCHTPIAAACCRLACKNIRMKSKIAGGGQPLRVLYTAHGFHFYKGAPKKNWLVYYPVEWLCAHWTDKLITINNEDYEFAKRKFEGLGSGKNSLGCRIEYVPGVGIDVDKFAHVQVDKSSKKKEIGVPEDAFLLLSVGELSVRKNHSVVIKALAELPEEYSNYHYAIAGEGPLHDDLLTLTKELGLSERVHLLGHRNDVNELYKAADLFIHPALQEGLPVAVMEAMASGIPCAGSKIRGNEDLMPSEKLFEPHDVKAIKEIICRSDNYTFSPDAMSKYGVDGINKRMVDLYGE